MRPLSVITIFFLLVFPLALFGEEKESSPADDPSAGIKSFVQGYAFIRKHCIDCHQPENKEGNLDLTPFKNIQQIANEYSRWNKVITRIQANEMPPEESEQPGQEEKEQFINWLTESMHREICDDGISPGPPMLRRLNRNEYANTIRDLLGIHINAGHALPSDGAGGEGFDNAAETLFISPIHAEKYLEAAQTALEHAMKDPRGRKRLLIATPGKELSPEQAARKVIEKFLPSAFRRPVTEKEISEFVTLFQSAYEQDKSYESSLQFALKGILMSPGFLFLWEEPNPTTNPVLVTDNELAVRLSYFLWETMPDQTLFQLAKDGKLSDETVLKNEVTRMLTIQQKNGDIRRSSRIRDFVESFTEQWLGTRALGREFKPDVSIAKGYDSELEGGMKYEPVFFFEDILIENRSLLTLIDSDFTFVNRRLASHYNIKGEFREQPKYVKLEEGSKRGGILSMASVLAISSYPHRTSPVLRGKYVLETLLGTPPPAPPPNVPELEENKKGEEPKTLRERLEKHRANATCASCHDSIDPLGFGLENYDVLGQWRTEVEGKPVDTKGKLPDGTEFNGPEELKKVLLDRKKQFIRHLTSKMLGYALGRGLTNEDYCAVDKIVNQLEKEDYKSHTLIREIVMSVPFRFKAGQNPPSPKQEN